MQRRTRWMSVMAPLAIVVGLSVWSFCATARLTFGVPPYTYSVETSRGALELERQFCCVRLEAPRLEISSAQSFDREFYREWQRVFDVAEGWGVFRCHIGYVVSDEALQWDPDLAVTPATHLAISHGLLLVITGGPVLMLYTCLMLRRRWRHARNPGFTGQHNPTQGSG